MENLGKQTALKRPVGSAEMSRNTQNGSKTDCREHLSANLTMGFTDIGFAVSVAPCPRLGKDESMIVAMSKLEPGTILAKGPWVERVNYFVTSDADAAEHGEICTFSEEERRALGGGFLVGSMFHVFGAMPGGVLQLMCRLIEIGNDQCVGWVKNGTMRRHLPTVENKHATNSGESTASSGECWAMSGERHKACIDWLKSRKTVAPEHLVFWAVRANIAALFHMVTANSFNMEFILSSCMVGAAFAPELSFFNHDCVPNALVERLPSGYTVYALTTIAAGEEVCISYMNEAVGLKSLDELFGVLHRRYGFACRCPSHLETRPLVAKGVRPPLSIAVLCYKNKVLKSVLDQLDQAFNAKEWMLVQSICEESYRVFRPLIDSEPRLAFVLSSRFVQTIQYENLVCKETASGAAVHPSMSGVSAIGCFPDSSSNLGRKRAGKWLDMLERVCEAWCVNPIYVQRVHFWRMLLHIRKHSIVNVHASETRFKYDFRPPTEREFHTFIKDWITLRQKMRSYYGGDGDSAVGIDCNLYGGMSDYFADMRPTVEFIEALIQGLEEDTKKSVAVTVETIASLCAEAQKTTEKLFKLQEEEMNVVTMEEMEQFIREANPQFYPAPAAVPIAPIESTVDKEEAVKKRRRKKRAVKMSENVSPPCGKMATNKSKELETVETVVAPLSEKIMLTGAYWTEDTFIPSQNFSDEDLAWV